MCDIFVECIYSQKLIKTGLHLALVCMYEASGLLLILALRFVCFMPHMQVMCQQQQCTLKLCALCVKLVAQRMGWTPIRRSSSKASMLTL